jgi:hypothetical protein
VHNRARTFYQRRVPVAANGGMPHKRYSCACEISAQRAVGSARLRTTVGFASQHGLELPVFTHEPAYMVVKPLALIGSTRYASDCFGCFMMAAIALYRYPRRLTEIGETAAGSFGLRLRRVLALRFQKDLLCFPDVELPEAEVFFVKVPAFRVC